MIRTQADLNLTQHEACYSLSHFPEVNRLMCIRRLW